MLDVAYQSVEEMYRDGNRAEPHVPRVKLLAILLCNVFQRKHTSGNGVTQDFIKETLMAQLNTTGIKWQQNPT